MCSKTGPGRLKVFVLTIVLVQNLWADLQMTFQGKESVNPSEVTWTFSGCLTVETATISGPLNDTSWLYPDGGSGWAFFSDSGTFRLNYDSANSVQNTLGKVFNNGTRSRVANGGAIKQTVDYIPLFPPPTYQNWALGNFGGDIPGRTGPDDEFAGDGVANYFEYATNTGPSKTFFARLKVSKAE